MALYTAYYNLRGPILEKWFTNLSTVIARIEAVGLLLALATCEDMRNKLWVFFIYSTAAKDFLIKGSSVNAGLNQLMHVTWQKCGAAACICGPRMSALNTTPLARLADHILISMAKSGCGSSLVVEPNFSKEISKNHAQKDSKIETSTKSHRTATSKRRTNSFQTWRFFPSLS